MTLERLALNAAFTMLALAPMPVGAHAALIGSHLILGGSDCQIVSVDPNDGTMAADCVDGRTWTFDSDGQPVPGIATNPQRQPGWYVVEGSAS